MNRKIQNEAELIATYLAPLSGPGGLGLADDCALIAADGGHDLVVTTDPIISGVHFFPDEAPRDVAWKALAVNVSDLVAKGAEPVAYTLTLALPEAPTHKWMKDFALGLGEAQAAFGCRLIGGDTDRTPGALSAGITAFGRVPAGGMVKRLTARPGDHVFVTGTIGDSALGLALRRGSGAFADLLSKDERDRLIGRYLRPAPGLKIIPLLRAHATAALDISDGLVQDAGKLAKGADAALALHFAQVPLSVGVRTIAAQSTEARCAIVSGGDDYEVLFAVPPDRAGTLSKAAAQLGVAVTEIGVLTEGEGVTVFDVDGRIMPLARGGYDHFGSGSFA